MPAKKTTARKKAEPKEPEPPSVEGFTTSDYEGNALFVCERCGYDTFSTELANDHRAEHERTDQNAAELAELTEHLPETAQVTTEGTDDEG